MNGTISFGGWVAPRASTGSALGPVRLIGMASAALMAVVAAVGTGSELQVERLLEKLASPGTVCADVAASYVERTPSEDLDRIREVLSPAVSDLAAMFGVTRQSVYNWLNGEPVAPENALKLRDLAAAADLFAYERVAVNSTLLKRKFAHGKTLFQVAQAGESARDAAATLLQIIRRESVQRERMSARFAGRAKTPATADFDLPAADRHA